MSSTKQTAQEKFITKAIAKHGNKYTYNKVQYVKSTINVTITCPTHGDFEQKPAYHIQGRGCSKCSGVYRHTTESYIKDASDLHNNVYDYSKTYYVNNATKITIVCKQHGEFHMIPKKHLNSHGCPKCKVCKVNTVYEFVRRSTITHDNKYKYDMVSFDDINDIITIICDEHGEFEQNAYRHMTGRKCPQCVEKYQHEKLTKERFIEKSNITHDNKYDYSHVVFVDSSTKVDIKCNIHGLFSQNPIYHMNINGCPDCGGVGHITTEKFIDNAIKVHGDRYDYSKVEYITNSTKITITCEEHGEFEQKPNNHLNGQNCPLCVSSISQGERDIMVFLDNKHINYVFQKRFPDCRDQRTLPFDFFLIDLEILIEYDGRQHFVPTEHWGGQEALENTQRRDEIKNKFSRDNGIRLVRIRYDDDIDLELRKILDT